MRKLLLASLLLLSGQALAGPPGGVSGRMTFDEVADGLRKYRKETDEETRLQWLEELGRHQDVRVIVAMGEWLAVWRGEATFRGRTGRSS